MFTQKKLFSLLSTTAIAVGVAFSGSVAAQQMRVSSFEPQPGFHSRVLQAWIDEINPQLTDGASFRLYPGSMLGSPTAQAELVENGVADVALVVPTYTPGTFPMTSVAEVPHVAPTSMTGMNVMNSLLEEEMLDGEFDDYKVIALWTTPGYRIFTADEAVQTPEDMNGKRIRTPSPFGSKLLGMLGASGTPIPAPQVYENIERNVVDGAIWAMDAYGTFRLDEVAPNVTRTRLIATPMTILMNKDRYESLSPENRAVIDSMSLRERSAWVAEQVDASEKDIEASMAAEGVNFIDLNASQQQEWDDVLSEARNLWLEDKPDQAAAVIDRALELAEE